MNNAGQGRPRRHKSRHACASRLGLASKDKAILAELGLDARQNLTALARKVRLSKQVVSYRIKQLEKMLKEARELLKRAETELNN